MKRRAHPTRIGLFVLGAVALLVLAVWSVFGAQVFAQRDRAVAQFEGSVYGLQVGAGGPLAVGGLLRAISQSLQRNFGRTIVVELEDEPPHVLPEPESIPVALTVNELLTNALKHGQGGDVLRAMIDGLKASGDGKAFVLTHFPRPGQQAPAPKLQYLKAVPGWNWF
ncbi:MAG: cache domain-containing protein, partial [Phycisphaerae bacterium]|nr:cache domain-containing protein [Phycisphaerae bacterium]